MRATVPTKKCVLIRHLAKMNKDEKSSRVKSTQRTRGSSVNN